MSYIHGTNLIERSVQRLLPRLQLPAVSEVLRFSQETPAIRLLLQTMSAHGKYWLRMASRVAAQTSLAMELSVWVETARHIRYPWTIHAWAFPRSITSRSPSSAPGTRCWTHYAATSTLLLATRFVSAILEMQHQKSTLTLWVPSERRLPPPLPSQLM